jgi:hypothetical protein
MPAAEFEGCFGLVVSSRERMASSRSVTAVEAPCMGVPPVMEILVAEGLGPGPGVDDREAGFELGLELGLDLDFGASKSETRLPAADGGALDGGGVADFGGGAFVGPSLGCDGVEVPDLAGMYSSSWLFLL